LLTLSDSPSLQRRAAEIYARDKFPPPAALPVFPPRSPRRRIRIGYYSADFHTHAICNLMVELFERSDRTHFELFAFSFGAHPHDQMTQRVAAAMDRFLDVRSLSDSEISQRSRELEIDIAVDLMGFTLHCRTGIFSHRAAPIQVSYLGLPATMGCDAIDYLIADATLIPESSRQYYSEKIVYLPDTFQATNSTVAPDSIPCTRAGEGLPEHGFVFCCFNLNSKIGPATFDIWMRILDRVPGSVLWLLQDNPWSAENLRQQAVLRGIDPGRLIFAKRVPLAQHLSRQRLAGLFLDTFPFNAGATASPALWAGLPVLTCMGQTFAGRMAASLLRAMSLPESTLAELITTSEQEYEARAIELALDPERLRQLRERLDRNRRTTPLFDTAAFTRHLEAAYTAMFARHQSNLPPDHIHVARSAQNNKEDFA
jgi:predicted O-linked N-acetylglucosamine transferase (SPINDLY family)